jgi:GH35 family endo-1,4-beta-xylanase
MKFQVFKNGKAVDKFQLCGAYLFGNDGIAIRKAQIAFEDGFIECKKPNMETAGLTLLWPIEGFGKVLLPTTCLPERDRPYNLNVEIARAKLMQIINKREEWSFFEGIDGPGDTSRQARDLFIQAVQNISDATLASRLADESLEKAVVFSEELAEKQTETLFETRNKSKGFGRGCLGCKIEPSQISNPAYVEKLLELFGFVTIPISWGQMEAEEGVYDFSKVDACVEALVRKKLSIGAGPLLCFSKEYLPAWLLDSKTGFEKIRDSAYKFVLKAVSRYSNHIRTWRVISGLNAYNYFGFNFEQILEITRAANMAVKAASERTIKIVEISDLWGEYYATVPNTVPPLVYMDMVVQGGINFDVFGLQMRFGKNRDGMHLRDMMHISAILDYFGHIGKPLHITEVEVPGRDDSDSSADRADKTHYQKWDQAWQEQWIERFYKIAFSKPFVESVTYSNLADTESNTIAGSGLLTGQSEPKKSFRTLKKLHKIIFNR